MQNMESFLMTDMKEFPHLTNLNTPGLTHERLSELLENMDEESDSDDICEDETICKLNFKTWVYTKLENRDMANSMNEKVVFMTKEENIMAVANRVFLSYRAGREDVAWTYCSKLRSMKERQDFEMLIAVANAELAYCYSRIGGPLNLFKAIQILEDFSENYPHEYFWKLRLGLVYRRSTHLNIFTNMPRGLPLLEYVKRSAAILNDVVQNSANDKLRGPACSELAVLCKYAKNDISEHDHYQIFKNTKPNQICDESLKYGADSTWVLTNYGKVQWPKKAIPVLKKCLEIRKHTTTHHHLGLCYMKEATYEPNQKHQDRRSTRQCDSWRQNAKFQPGRNVSRDEQTMSRTNFRLDSRNENVLKAEHEYLEAINLSHNRNVPAIYDLGLLYKATGQEDKALVYFNMVTNSGMEQHLTTIIKAYEQAGQIYMMKKDYEALGEQKLTKAISLAMRVASTCPEFPLYAPEMWKSFGTIKGSVNTEVKSPNGANKLINLFELVRKHGKVVKAVEQLLALSDSELKDADVIKSGLNSYLKMGEPEKALAFLCMLSARADITSLDSWTSEAMVNLRNKVFLCAAQRCLQYEKVQARFVFQELFKLHYGQCAGCASEDTTDVSKIKDVLLLYDDDDDTEGQSTTHKTVQSLYDVLSQVFGLNTSTNLEDCFEYGPKLAVQLTEMGRYQLVVVVLGEEERTNQFEALLKKIPSLRRSDDQAITVLVIDSSHVRPDVPGVLKQYGCFRLEDMGYLGHTNQGANSCREQNIVDDIIEKCVGENLDGLMKLFCFLIKQNWPCL